jgi:hypothetical protein
MTWTNVGSTLPANTNCTLPVIIDSQTHLVGCGGFGGGPRGVYRTTDGAVTWTNVTTSGGGTSPLLATDGSIYWPSPDGKGITRSTDQGQHWTDVVGPGVVRSTPPIELPDGRLVTLGGQLVLISSDKGSTWHPASPTLPFGDPTGVVYSRQQKAFVTWHFTCQTNMDPVPPDAIMRFDFDYQKN